MPVPSEDPQKFKPIAKTLWGVLAALDEEGFQPHLAIMGLDLSATGLRLSKGKKVLVISSLHQLFDIRLARGRWPGPQVSRP